MVSPSRKLPKECCTGPTFLAEHPHTCQERNSWAVRAWRSAHRALVLGSTGEAGQARTAPRKTKSTCVGRRGGALFNDHECRLFCFFVLMNMMRVNKYRNESITWSFESVNKV